MDCLCKSRNVNEDKMALDSRHKSALQKLHCKLAERIDVKLLIPYLKDVLDDYLLNQVSIETTSFRQAEKLLSIVKKGGSATFAYFMKALDSCYPHLAAQIRQELNASGSKSPLASTRRINGKVLQEEIVKEQRIRKNSNNIISSHYTVRDGEKFRQLENHLIRKYRLHLHKMNINQILPLCNSLNDTYHVQLINAEQAQFQKAEKLLDILLRLGPQAFEEFINALQNVDPDLGSLIMDELNMNHALILT